MRTKDLRQKLGRFILNLCIEWMNDGSLLVGKQVIIGKSIGLLRGRNSCCFFIITVIKLKTKRTRLML